MPLKWNSWSFFPLKPKRCAVRSVSNAGIACLILVLVSACCASVRPGSERWVFWNSRALLDGEEETQAWVGVGPGEVRSPIALAAALLLPIVVDLLVLPVTLVHDSCIVAESG